MKILKILKILKKKKMERATKNKKELTPSQEEKRKNIELKNAYSFVIDHFMEQLIKSELKKRVKFFGFGSFKVTKISRKIGKQKYEFKRMSFKPSLMIKSLIAKM